MHGAPRAASASLFDPVSPGRRGWGKELRLLRASEFAALAQTRPDWHATRRWIAMSARFTVDSGSATGSAAGSAAGSATRSATRSATGPTVEPTADAAAEHAGDSAASSLALRFGLAVSKRQAKRAVARNMVKRVLREAARHAAPGLGAAAAGAHADVLLRLKSPLPAAAAMNWATLKLELRGEADALLAQLAERLRTETQRRGRSAPRAAGPAQARESALAGRAQAAPPMLAQSTEPGTTPGKPVAGAPS